MESVRTNFALGSVGGMPVILNEYYVDRPSLRNERNISENPFISYANARDLPEFLIAVDGMLDEFFMTDLLTDLVAFEKPEPLSIESAAEICGFFGSDSPTRTMLEKTREAIELWNLSNAKQKFEYNLGNGKKGRPMYLFTPLEDFIVAAEDLRRTSLLMSWLIGKTDFKTAHGMPEGDRQAKMRTLSADEPKFLHDYYEKLRDNSGNELEQFGLSFAVAQAHLYHEDSIESTVAGYVEACFTVLMSDERKKMTSELYTEKYFNTVLCAAWSYFADGLNKEGTGAISVCKHCGKFFEQHRSTKQFCSDSCRVMHLRNCSADDIDTSDSESYITSIQRMRNNESVYVTDEDLANQFRPR